MKNIDKQDGANYYFKSLRDKVVADANMFHHFSVLHSIRFTHRQPQQQLGRARHIRFLLGDPYFISALDPEKTKPKAFMVEGTSSLALTREA
jgi:hypothetical protein